MTGLPEVIGLLYRADWTLRPAGRAWYDLVFKDWWTPEQRSGVDAHGEFQMRGFQGDYMVEVRVGSYDFDSSRFAMQGFGQGGAPFTGQTVLAPLDDDYDALRRAIWLTTDETYKRAVNVFA